jgi:putative ABC transport system substrate-binding protein
MGIKTVDFVAGTGKALEMAFMWLRSDRCDALYIASGPLGPAKRAEVLSLTRELRLPAMYSYPVFPAAGGLISFSPDEADLYRRAAGYVDKILRGASPADLPVEPPARFELAINRRTARTLGLEIPPSMLAQAAEIIE